MNFADVSKIYRVTKSQSLNFLKLNTCIKHPVKFYCHSMSSSGITWGGLFCPPPWEISCI